MQGRRGRSSQPEWPATGLAGVYNELRADYTAARTTNLRKRLRGVASGGSGADYHYRNEGDYLRLMEMARSFERNDIVVGQGVTRLVDNVCQGVGWHGQAQRGHVLPEAKHARAFGLGMAPRNRRQGCCTTRCTNCWH